MGEFILKGLLTLIFIAIAVFACFWVFDIIGLHLPDIIEKLIWAAVAVFALLILFRIAKKQYPGDWW